MKNFIKELVPYVVIIVAIILIRTYIVTPVRVDGVSMNPTLENKEILVLNKLDKSFERFDVVVFNYDNKKLVKRIVGLPGETIEYKDNKLYINGKVIKENFTHKDTGDFKYDFEIPRGQYFVVGDNRTNSLDSRYIGLIRGSDIDGTVKVSVFPPKIIK